MSIVISFTTEIAIMHYLKNNLQICSNKKKASANMAPLSGAIYYTQQYYCGLPTRQCFSVYTMFVA